MMMMMMMMMMVVVVVVMMRRPLLMMTMTRRSLYLDQLLAEGSTGVWRFSRDLILAHCGCVRPLLKFGMGFK